MPRLVVIYFPFRFHIFIHTTDKANLAFCLQKQKDDETKKAGRAFVSEVAPGSSGVSVSTI